MSQKAPDTSWPSVRCFGTKLSTFVSGLPSTQYPSVISVTVKSNPIFFYLV